MYKTKGLDASYKNVSKSTPNSLREVTLSSLHPIYVLTEAPVSSIQIDSLHVTGEQLFTDSTFELVHPSKMICSGDIVAWVSGYYLTFRLL